MFKLKQQDVWLEHSSKVRPRRVRVVMRIGLKVFMFPVIMTAP